MKKVFLMAVILCFVCVKQTVFAQEITDEKKKELDEKKKVLKEKTVEYKKLRKDYDEKNQSQEIVIRKKGDKDTKITVEINGDKIMVNGKSLADFKDENITVNKRNITIWDNKGNKSFEMVPGEFLNGMSFSGTDDNPHAFLGVTTETIEDDKDNNKVPGAKISNVTNESAAEKAGLKTGDIITKIDDKKIENPQDLTEVIGDKKPKDEVTVYYKRDGKENSAKAILGERKVMSYSFTTPNGFRSNSIPPMNTLPRLRTEDWNMEESQLGKLYSTDNNLKMYGDMFPRHQKLGLKIQDTEDGNGVKVLDVDKDSPAEKAGLKKDDIVTEVGGKKIKNTDEAREQLQENAEKAAYNIKAKRNGSEMNFDIRIPKKLKTANL